MSNYWRQRRVYVPKPVPSKPFPWIVVIPITFALFFVLHGYLWMQYYLGETVCEWIGGCK